MKASVYTNEMMYLFLQKESNIGEYLFLQNRGHLQCFSEMIDILKPHHKAAEYKGSRVGLGPALSCWEFCSNPKPRMAKNYWALLSSVIKPLGLMKSGKLCYEQWTPPLRAHTSSTWAGFRQPLLGLDGLTVCTVKRCCHCDFRTQAAVTSCNTTPARACRKTSNYLPVWFWINFWWL